MKDLLINNLFLGIIKGDPDLGTSAIIAISAILAVFAILYIIILCIQLMEKIVVRFNKNKATKEPVVEQESVQQSPKSVEIVDEDMMVAALIATVDYTTETKKDVKLKSIKRIG